MKLKGLPAIFVTHTTSLFLGKEWMSNRLCQSAGAREAEKHIEWRVFLVLTASVGLQFPGAWPWGPSHIWHPEAVSEEGGIGGTKHRTSVVVAVVVVSTVSVLQSACGCGLSAWPLFLPAFSASGSSTFLRCL